MPYTTVMHSYGYWQQRFGGDPSVVGRTLMVDGRPKKVVGVMPEGFRIVNAEGDLIFPLAFDVTRFADDVARTGATWVILTVGQNSGYYCAPNSVIKKY